MKNYSLVSFQTGDKPQNAGDLKRLLERETLFDYEVVPVRVRSCFPYPENLFLVISALKNADNPPCPLKECRAFLLSHLQRLEKCGVGLQRFGFGGALKIESETEAGSKEILKRAEQLVHTAPSLLSFAFFAEGEKMSGYVLLRRRVTSVPPYFKSAFADIGIEFVPCREILG